MDCKSCRMGSIKPIALMVEQVENPLGIFRRQPRFFLADTLRSEGKLSEILQD